MKSKQQSRRDFLRTMGAAAMGLTAASCAPIFGSDQKAGAGLPAAGGLPMRALGNTGETVSLLGLGGQGALDRSSVSDEDAIAIVKRAFELGIDYVDTAAWYGSGLSETRIGQAIKEAGKPRRELFLATKSIRTSYSNVMSDFDNSLNRLQTDYVDLYQIHNVGPDYNGFPAPNIGTLFNPDGQGRTAMDAFIRLRDEGRARFIGLTGHHDPDYLLDVLNHPQAPSFDAVLMALNPADWHTKPFQQDLLPAALARNMAVIAMKVTGLNRLESTISMTQRLGYVYSLPISCAIVGISNIAELDQNVQITQDFTEPLTPEQMLALEQLTSGTPESGTPPRGDWFKIDRY